MSTLPKQAIREASAWLVELNSGEATEGDQQRWQQWYQHSPENQAAWDKIEQFRHQLQGAPAAAVHRAVDGADRVLLQRRALLKSLLALAIIPPAAYTGYRHSPWYADYQTAHGELAAHTLTDGTELMLNTHTAVDIRYASDQRTLFLRHGEILVTTAKPAGESRPFHVQTAHGTVRALGTRFSVYTDRNTSRVDVYEHATRITPTANFANGVQLEAGYGAQFNQQAVHNTKPITANSAAWTRRMLVVDDWSLTAFIDELSRYRAGHLGCHESVAELRISGSFPLQDTDQILEVLPQILPVKVRYLTPYWVAVGER